MHKKHNFDHHGLKLKEIQRIDGQNWVIVKKIFQRKVQKCFNMLQNSGDIHQEKTLGIELYLKICADYIEIFLSLGESTLRWLSFDGFESLFKVLFSVVTN
jgi:hypothetical protein